MTRREFNTHVRAVGLKSMDDAVSGMKCLEACGYLASADMEALRRKTQAEHIKKASREFDRSESGKSRYKLLLMDYACRVAKLPEAAKEMLRKEARIRL
jgi:hypothetical protein